MTRRRALLADDRRLIQIRRAQRRRRVRSRRIHPRRQSAAARIRTWGLEGGVEYTADHAQRHHHVPSSSLGQPLPPFASRPPPPHPSRTPPQVFHAADEQQGEMERRRGRERERQASVIPIKI